MHIRLGYRISFDCVQPTPMLLMLRVHPERRRDLLSSDRIVAAPAVVVTSFRDPFGNVGSRLVAPAGSFTVSSTFTVRDHGMADPVAPSAREMPVEMLPDDVLPYVLGSRYVDTDRLSDAAWSLFGAVPPGWARVQAICDYVHDRIAFGYGHASATRSASQAHEERKGVCRDYAHLAIAFCRCLNIPARYCTGYLGDIGVPVDPAPMDFSAWFEAFLDGTWYTFDARHNRPRVGRVLIARGRDATDVAISTAFGTATLARFDVVSDEVRASVIPAGSAAA